MSFSELIISVQVDRPRIELFYTLKSVQSLDISRYFIRNLVIVVNIVYMCVRACVHAINFNIVHSLKTTGIEL